MIDIRDEQSDTTRPLSSLSNITTAPSTKPNADEDGYEQCPNCSRKFFSGRLVLHLKSCKPNKPLKRLKKATEP